MEIIVTVSERAHRGLTQAASNNSLTIEALASEVVQRQGEDYANLLGIGVITGAGFVLRMEPAEVLGILQAAKESPEVAALVQRFAEVPTLRLDDEQFVAGLGALTTLGENPLLSPERVSELLSYESATPVDAPETPIQDSGPPEDVPGPLGQDSQPLEDS